MGFIEMYSICKLNSKCLFLIGHRDPEHSNSDRTACCHAGKGCYRGTGWNGERGG